MATARAQMDTRRSSLERAQRLFDDGARQQGGPRHGARGSTTPRRPPTTRPPRTSAAADGGDRRAAGAAQPDRRRTSATRRSTRRSTASVVTRSIDPGATVVASFQAPVLFVIAQDLRKMRVLADVDEADVGQARGEDGRPTRWSTPSRARSSTASSQQVRYQPEHRLGGRDVLGGRRGREPRREAPPGDDGHGRPSARTRRRGSPRAERRAPLQADPPQGPDGKPIPPPPEPPLAKGQGRVYVLTSDKPGDEKEEQKLVRSAMTDGIFTR